MDHEVLQFPDVPRAELEKTIGDLISQAQRVLTVQGRLRALLQAYRSVIEELDLDRVLVRIVEAAVELVGARFGALGVIDAEGGMERFVHVGMPAHAEEAIGRLPEGRGLLGAVIRSGQSIRLAHLGADPRSVGFPPHHPAMESFLGVPIRVRGEIFGNLYLADPSGGLFTEEDEEVIESLAATAGIAIDNARLYEDVRRRERVSTAQSEVRAALLSPDTVDVLAVVAESVASVVPVELVAVVVPTADDGEMRVEVARGRDAERLSGLTFEADATPVGRAMRGESLATDDAWSPARADLRFGPTAAVPLVVAGNRVGALCVLRGQDSIRFTHAELDAVAEFAAQAGLAVALAWARRDRERLQVVEDRSRIARDLHDHVIQRLFAAGLGLQSLASLDREYAPALERHARELDAAISDIRTAIFALRENGGASSVARQRLLDVTREFGSMFSVTPRITFSGPVDLMLTGGLADDVVAVVRESLANAARHAQANGVDVSVVVSDADIAVCVEDDGVGIAADAPRSGGTANLAQRAQSYGGTFALEPGARSGTRMTWRVPIAG